MKKFTYLSILLIAAMACNPEETPNDVVQPISFDVFGFSAEANSKVISSDIVVESPAAGVLNIELPIGTPADALETLVPYFEVEEDAVVTVDGSTIESNVTVIDFSNTVDIYISKENRNALYSVNVSIKAAPKWRLLATSDNVTSGNFTMAISPDNIPYIATTVEVEVNVTDPDSGGQSVDTKEYPVLYRIESSFENALTAQYFFEEDAGAPSMSFDTEGTPYVAFSDERAENGEISVFKVDNGTATQIGASGVIYTSDGGDSFPIFYIADNDIYLAIHNGQKNVTVTRRALNLVHFDGAQWQNGVSLPGQDPSKASLKVLGQTVNGVHYIFAVDRSDPYAADIYKYDTVNGNTWENVAASLKPIAADGSTELGFTNLYCTAEFNVDNDGNIYFVTGANFVSADAFNPAVVRYNPGTKTQNIIGSVFTNISNDRYAMFKIAFDNTNTPYIVYKYDSMDAMINVSYLDNNTKQWSTPENIKVGKDPQICFDSEGNGYVAIVNEDDKIAVYTTKQ